MLKFFLGDPKGIALTAILSILGLYFLAPVFLHGLLWEGLILHLPYWVPLLIASAFAFWAFVRYSDKHNRLNAITATILVMLLLAGSGLGVLMSGWQSRLLYKQNTFTERKVPLGVSNTMVRFKPLEIAEQDMLRKNKSSEFSPGNLSAIGSKHGVAYIAPLTPQGVFNIFLMQNQSFLYLDDAGTDEERNRVSKLETDAFAWGEDMEVFDDIYRRLIRKVGFTNSYPEIYYAPVYGEDGELTEVVGVVPYISYSFHGVFVPEWGGVAIFHTDGQIEDLSPKEASKDPRLTSTYRAFPEKLDQLIVEAQRFDTSIIGGWIRRPGKIQVPDLPGDNRMPYFLAMEDDTYQYVTAVEPDGKGFSVMRIYYVDALTGERTVYRFDTAEMDDKNLVGPAKSLSFVKAIEGYNWYQKESGESGSGTYLLIEPRPVTPVGSDHLHWMITITDKEYSREAATAFVDAETNQVFGPYKTREQTFAFLAGKEMDQGRSSTVPPLPNLVNPNGEQISGICEEIATIYLDYCGSPLPR